MAIFETIRHNVDFCVVGGGLAGLCAAIAAARHGAKTLLMQDRTVLGGNCSSEVRVWVSGAEGRDCRETGILEELMMENQFHNPMKNYYVWDHILYQAAQNTPGLEVLLNCSCLRCHAKAGRIASVTGWQLTTQTYHNVRAKLFADCSGDSILAPMTKAQFRIGRESRSETGESIAPLKADQKTMGISCLLQAKEGKEAVAFAPPCVCTDMSEFLCGERKPELNDVKENFWYLELGGNEDTIRNCEAIRDKLLELDYSTWNHLKNSPQESEKNCNWYLDWIGMLPGKRESRRYIGDYILTQMDIENGGHFKDTIAYGGWPMDLHPPDGFDADEAPNVFHRVDGIYGIPYRCLYSKNVSNLFCAGRNISVTHVALGSTRVMGTCALLGQAVGTAAALAIEDGLEPRALGQQKMDKLQQTLLEDDVYLPHIVRRVPFITLQAELTASGENAQALRDGFDRPQGNDSHAWLCKTSDHATYHFHTPQAISQIRLILDSDLNREYLSAAECELKRNLFHNHPNNVEQSFVPPTMVKAYRISALLEDGREMALVEVRDNYHRLRRHSVSCKARSITLEILETWGNSQIRLFCFEVS